MKKKAWLIVSVLLVVASLAAGFHAWDAYGRYETLSTRAEKSAQSAHEAAAAVERSRAAGSAQGDRALRLQAESELTFLQSYTKQLGAAKSTLDQAALVLGALLVGAVFCLVPGRSS